MFNYSSGRLIFSPFLKKKKLSSPWALASTMQITRHYLRDDGSGTSTTKEYFFIYSFMLRLIVVECDSFSSLQVNGFDFY